MMDPATGWFKMVQILNKTAAEIADITEKTWFTRYPLSQQVVFDRGTEFMPEFDKMCHNDYGLKRKPMKTRNTQSNASIKQSHQTIGNIIRTFDVYNIINKHPWSGILAATIFAVRATYHTTQKSYPMQLEFGWDEILNINHVAYWEHIRQRKKLRIIRNNKCENMHQNNHQYKFGDKILVKRKKNSKHELEVMGLFPIKQINNNSTVRFQKGINNDATNILRIKTFFY